MRGAIRVWLILGLALAAAVGGVAPVAGRGGGQGHAGGILFPGAGAHWIGIAPHSVGPGPGSASGPPDSELHSRASFGDHLRLGPKSWATGVVFDHDLSHDNRRSLLITYKVCKYNYIMVVTKYALGV